MVFFASYDANGQVTAGPMHDGEVYSGIDEHSIFWPIVSEWVASGNVINPFSPYSPTPTVQDYQRAIQQLIEETAQSKQYDTAANLASYVASTVPVWAAQAQTFVAWRDAVWQYTYQQLEQFQLGVREQPSVTDFLTELPVIDWNEQ